MFEGTNPEPKPSTQNTRAANLQGDSKLAGFTIEELEGLDKYMEFAGKKKISNRSMLFILKGAPRILLANKDSASTESQDIASGHANACSIQPR